MRKIDELINAGEAASGSNDGAASATTAISGKPETSPGPGLIKKRKKSKPRSESAAGGGECRVCARDRLRNPLGRGKRSVGLVGEARSKVSRAQNVYKLERLSNGTRFKRFTTNDH